MSEGFILHFILVCNWLMERVQPFITVLRIFSQTFAQLVNRTSLLVSEVNLKFLTVLMVVKMASALLVRCGEEEDKPFIETSNPLIGNTTSQLNLLILTLGF